jgi:pimeloyl-ACP methyl ester carboxylesterase
MTLAPLDPDRRNNFWYSRGSHPTVIVFLHGIFSDSRSCWKNTSRTPSVLWPDLILADQRIADPSIYLAGYHTALNAGDFPVSQCAREVFDALRRPESDGTPPVLDSKQLIFVCHSTGGIVARYMLEKYRDQFEDKDIGLLLIASPSLGSGWANLAGLAAKYYNQRLGQQLRWNNEELQDLHGRFKDLVDQRASLMPGLYGREAAEHQMVFRDWIPSCLLWAAPPRWKVVNNLSAGQYFGSVKTLPNSNHFTAVKPDSVNHPGHQLLVDFWLDFQHQINQRALVRMESSTPTRPVSTAPIEATFLEGGALDRHAFTAFNATEQPAAHVFAYVEIQDLAAFREHYRDAINTMLEDPLISTVPELAATLRLGRFRFRDLDPELRLRFIDLVGELTFEAYVAWSQVPRGAEEVISLLANLLFIRLRGTDRDSIEIALAEPSATMKSAIVSAIELATSRIRRVDARTILGELKEAPAADAAGVVTQFIADVILTRLTEPGSPMARAFARIHPAKVRLINDFDRSEYFSRRRPLPSS